MQLKIKRLHPQAIIPKHATDGAACFDLHACIDEMETLVSGMAEDFGTGLAFEVPPGYALMVYSRSGHGFKHGVRLANCVGVIDSDYRGEVRVRLNVDGSGNLLHVKPGDRIAQAMLIPVPRVELVEVHDLSETARGAGGLGSTGA